MRKSTVSPKYIFTLVVVMLICGITVPCVMAQGQPSRKKVVAIKPDMDKIKAEVNDPDSKYYYPKLMQRYERYDTVMKLDDYRHLYLGMIFQEDYDPYRRSVYEKDVEDLYYKSTHTRAELDTIIRYAKLALDDDPFDLEQMNFLIFALRNRGKNNLANFWQYRLNHILEAILSTGTGLDKENAWVIIDPKHEYNIVNFHDMIVDNTTFAEPYHEEVTTRPAANKSGSSAKYYFNIKYILDEYYRKHPEQR